MVFHTVRALEVGLTGDNHAGDVYWILEGCMRCAFRSMNLR